MEIDALTVYELLEGLDLLFAGDSDPALTLRTLQKPYKKLIVKAAKSKDPLFQDSIRVNDSVSITPVEYMKILRFVKEDKKVPAIKVLKEATNLSLKDAKDTIDNWFKTGAIKDAKK